MRILIVKTGGTLPDIRARRGDFEDWFEAGLGVPCDTVDVAAGASLPDKSAWQGIVVTGSAAMVSSLEPWMASTADWLRRMAAEVPVLGVCFGHQLLARAYGGLVGSNPKGRQIGTTNLNLDAGDDPLLGGLPGSMAVQTSHCEVVLEPPPDAILLGHTAGDPHHVLRFDSGCWGVQFHPEFDADVMAGYLDGLADTLAKEGLDPAERRRNVKPTPLAATVLSRFADRICSGEQGGLEELRNLAG